MEEKKEWHIMRAEPVKETTVEIPNLWGAITPDDISQKGTGNFKADYMNWALTYHHMHENAPGWTFRLLPWKDQDQPQFIHKAPDGTGYVLGQWIHKESGMTLPEFPQACMNHRNQPIMYEQCDARTLTDTHRRALCTSAAASFGLAGELWARVPVEDPHVQGGEDVPANPFKSKAPKPKSVVADMCEHFKQFDVSAEMIATWAGVQDIKELEGNQGKITELRELFKACKAGGNPQILFSKEEEGEIEFNMGEQEL
jgi:hypothetical protein